MGGLFDCYKNNKKEPNDNQSAINDRLESSFKVENKQQVINVNSSQNYYPNSQIPYKNIDEKKLIEMKEMYNSAEQLKKQLEQKEKELEDEEKILQNQKNIYEANKTQLNSAQQKYNDDIIQLNSAQQKYNADRIQLNKDQQKYNADKIILNKEQQKLEEDKKLLNKEKEDFKKKEQELETKLIEKYKQREIELKQKEESILKEKKELSERETSITKSEKSFKEKEQEFFKKNQELKEYQKKFNEEKIFYENTIQTREDSLKKYDSSLKELQLSLDKEKKIIEEEKKKIENSKLPIEIGLQNIGATCYMNATLQALSNTSKLTEFFLTKYKYEPNNNNKKISNELYKVLTNLWDDNKKKGDYPPNDFKEVLSKENPLFAGIQPNDSKDLINFLLERLHQENNNPSQPNNQISNSLSNVNQLNEIETLTAFLQDYFSSNNSIITDLFYGICKIENKCTGCNYSKYNFQIYSFLEFPLKQVNLYMFQTGRRNFIVNQDGSNPDINLYECFDYYQKVDLMNGQNQMYCNICNINKDTYYGTTIYSLPNNLIINLNREKGGVYKCNVNFPETLNLLNYVAYKDGPTAMKLYAVICHFGGSDMSGHFIAYCKHRKTKEWYCYNDSVATKCTEKQPYNKGMPYILFYQAV